MDKILPIDISCLKVVLSRFEMMVLSMAQQLMSAQINQSKDARRALNARLKQARKIVQRLCEEIRLTEGFNYRLSVIARAAKDPVFRAKVRAIIGEAAIAIWWAKYRGTYKYRSTYKVPAPQPVHPPRSWQQKPYVWKAFSLHKVPHYQGQSNVRVLGATAERSARRESDPDQPVLFHGWQLEPEVKSAAKPMPSRVSQKAFTPRHKERSRPTPSNFSNNQQKKAPRRAPDIRNKSSPAITWL